LLHLRDVTRVKCHYTEVQQLRYFAQKSNKEFTRLLGVSLRTVENDLRFAKAYLKAKLN